MRWQRLRARVQQQDVARVEALLELAGAAAITLVDAGDQPLLEPLPGATPLWQSVQVEALFPEYVDLDTLPKLLTSAGAAAVRFDHLAQRDWVAVTNALERARRYGERLWVVPTGSDAVSATQPTVILSPGLAFGSGLHATTALCLEWLDAHPPLNQSVLDYGCGSGILGLAALKLGAARAALVDIDPQAISASRANAANNGEQDRVWVGLADDLGVASYDLLMANILAAPIVELVDRFANLSKPGGDLLLTGLLIDQANAVRRVYEARFESWSENQRDGWICLHGKRSYGS